MPIPQPVRQVAEPNNNEEEKKSGGNARKPVIPDTPGDKENQDTPGKPTFNPNSML